MWPFDLLKKKKISSADIQGSTGKDFEFLITGDIDVFSDWDKVMTPNSLEWKKTERDNWVYYNIGGDEFSYSIEPPGIQMMFNDNITYSKAKQIADEIIENIKATGQEANLEILIKNKIYKFE